MIKENEGDDETKLFSTMLLNTSSSVKKSNQTFTSFDSKSDADLAFADLKNS